MNKLGTTIQGIGILLVIYSALLMRDNNFSWGLPFFLVSWFIQVIGFYINLSPKKEKNREVVDDED
jgi:predicted membrane channel-forming protein YqfA (hemolysin III family)